MGLRGGDEEVRCGQGRGAQGLPGAGGAERRGGGGRERGDGGGKSGRGFIDSFFFSLLPRRRRETAKRAP